MEYHSGLFNCLTRSDTFNIYREGDYIFLDLNGN